MVLPKQKHRLWSWLQSNLGLLPIVLTWLLIVVTNYKPNTWLLGWDMITSSFNPLQSVGRALFGVWQDFQGLGVLGGHGYGASLPEALVQLVLSFFLPQSQLRSALVFLLVLVGAIGAYVLVVERVVTHFKLPRLQRGVIGSVVGLVYLLNLATVQTFYVGLEPFMWVYAVFPWVLWQLFGVLEEPAWKGFFGFLCLHLVFSVVGLIPPVFIAYVFFLGVILLTWWLQQPGKARFWISVQLIGLVLVANLYWLVPVGMFTVFQSSEYLNSQLNQLSTEEFIYRSQYYGQLDKAAVFESFYFDSLDQDRFGQGAYSSIMFPWQQWLHAPYVRWLDYGLLAGSFVGWLLMLRYLHRSKKPVWSLGILGILSFAILASGTPVLAELSYPLRSLPILNQAFRLPFSKISMFLSLFVALGWGVLLLSIWQLLVPRLKKTGQIVWWLAVTLVVGVVIYTTWPVFRGHFLYAGAKVALPKEYLGFMQIFKEKIHPRARVAMLPIFTYTGWDMHNWGQKQGYTGSGFWWYAIPQSLLHRSFDVWNSTNEMYRYELQTAMYDQDLSAIKMVLNKYQISYVLFDSSVYLPEKPNEVQQLEQTRQLVAGNPDFILMAQAGTLSLYRFVPVSERAGIFVPPFYSSAQSLPERARTDQHFKNLGYTIASDERVFPFDHLTLVKTNHAEIGDYIKITAPENANAKYQTMVLPKLTGERIRFNVILRREGESAWLQLQPILPSFIFKTAATNLLDVTEVQLPTGSIEQNPEIIINQQSFVIPYNQLNSELFVLGGVTLQYQEPVLVRLNAGKIELDLTTETWAPATVVLRAEKQDQTALMTAYLPAQKYVWRPHENTLVNCSFGKVGQIKRIASGDGVEYSAENRGAACDYLHMSELKLDSGMLLRIQGENLSGQSLKLYVRNLETDKTELEYRLPKGKYDEVLSLLPVAKTAKGLSLILETRSFGAEVSRNTVERIELFSVPMRVLLNTAVQTDQNVQLTPQTALLGLVQQFGSGVFSFTLLAEKSTIIALSTSYDRFWLAFDLRHGRFLPHKIMNSWANAWEVPAGTSRIIVFYLPQLLVWIAFLVMLVVAAVIWKKSQLAHKHSTSDQLRKNLLGHS